MVFGLWFWGFGLCTISGTGEERDKDQRPKAKGQRPDRQSAIGNQKYLEGLS
jgi:hypothetical protein